MSLKLSLDDDFEFRYRFWYESVYVITNKYRTTIYDANFIAKVISLSIYDTYELIEEFNPSYITTHGYNNMLVFKKMEDVERVVEWLNANLVLNRLLS